MIQAIAPHSVKCESVSTSAVTRATKTPRFSSDCSAIESRWMCSNVSHAQGHQRLLGRAHQPARGGPSRDVGEDDQDERRTRTVSARTAAWKPSVNPLSKIRLTKIGVTSSATVTPSETIDREAQPLAELGGLVQPVAEHRRARCRCGGISSSGSTDRHDLFGRRGAHRCSIRSYARIIAAYPGIGREEFLVRSRRAKLPVLEVKDPVGQADRRQPVGDDDERRAELGAERPQDLGLDRWGPPRRSRRRGSGARGCRTSARASAIALPLAARQRVPALADHGVDTARQLADEPLGLGDPGGPLHLVVGRSGVQRDVVADAGANRKLSWKTIEVASRSEPASASRRLTPPTARRPGPGRPGGPAAARACTCRRPSARRSPPIRSASISSETSSSTG